jgi:hypothetical protein
MLFSGAMFLMCDRKQRFVKNQCFFSLFAKRIYKSAEFMKHDCVTLNLLARCPTIRTVVLPAQSRGLSVRFLSDQVRQVACNVKTSRINPLEAGSATRMYHWLKKIILLKFLNKWSDRKSVPTVIMCGCYMQFQSLLWSGEYVTKWYCWRPKSFVFLDCADCYRQFGTATASKFTV